MAGQIQLAKAKYFSKSEGIIIAPSLLSANVLNMEGSIDALEGKEDWLHVDIMDGHFVPNLSYGPSLVKSLRKKYPDRFIDVHIMVEPAEDFLDMFLAASPSLLTVHLEAARHIHRVLQKIKNAGVLCGVSINPGTAPALLAPVLHMADLVLVMSVNPGYGGQSFIPEALNSVKWLDSKRRECGYNYLIEIDGGVSVRNIADAAAAGCDAAVAGSAIFGAENPSRMIDDMRAAVHAQRDHTECDHNG